MSCDASSQHRGVPCIHRSLSHISSLWFSPNRLPWVHGLSSMSLRCMQPDSDVVASRRDGENKIWETNRNTLTVSRTDVILRAFLIYHFMMNHLPPALNPCSRTMCRAERRSNVSWKRNPTYTVFFALKYISFRPFIFLPVQPYGAVPMWAWLPHAPWLI